MKSWIICIKTKGFFSKYGKYQNGYPQLEGWLYFAIGLFFNEEIWSYILFKNIAFKQLVFFNEAYLVPLFPHLSYIWQFF
jgi:hypothetical protein